MNEKVLHEIFNKIIMICESAKGYLDAYTDTKNDEEENNVPLKVKKGTIIKRKDNRYETRVSINGKQVTTGYASSYTAAVKQHNEKLKQLLPKPRDISKVKLYEWLDEYLEAKSKHVSKSTWKHDEIIIRLHIKPAISDMPLKNIKPMTVERILSAGTSDRIQEDTYKVLSEFLRKAKENDLIEKNPCDYVKKIKATRKKGTALSTEQQSKLLEAVENTSKFPKLYFFMLYTGCRPDEALRMHWEYIDWKNDTMYIDGTKNQTSSRTIPLFKDIQSLLEETREEKGKIFKVSYQMLKDDCDKVKKTLNFEFTPKTLRHTFGTRLYEKGIDLKVISKWMGHAKLETTEKIYIDVLSEHETKQSQKVKF